MDVHTLCPSLNCYRVATAWEILCTADLTDVISLRKYKYSIRGFFMSIFEVICKV